MVELTFTPSAQLTAKYEILEEIGRGSFGTVHKAINKESGVPVAIKRILKSFIKSEDEKNRLFREINIMKEIDHPFTAEFYELIDEPEAFFIVMEYVENSNLLEHLQSEGALPESLARRYFSQIISVLDYLHNIRHVAHRDLKAENILLDRNNNIRIIDFGLSNVFTDETPLLKTTCGSPAYAAPEMVRGQKYTKNADIWSAGVVLYSMVTGHLPFFDQDMQKLVHMIIYQQPVYPETLSYPLNDLIHKMLIKCPQERITLERVKEHPWFSKFEHKQFLKSAFATDKMWKVTGIEKNGCGIDRSIVEKIAQLGYNTEKIHSDLFNKFYSDIAILYRMLKREKITDEMGTLVDMKPIPLSSSCKISDQMYAGVSYSAASNKREEEVKLDLPKPVKMITAAAYPVPCSRRNSVRRYVSEQSFN